MAKIFISYKRVDKEKVFLIVDRIQNDLNETCWMDIDEIESDAQFASVIINAIDEASVFLFMYSKAHTIIDNFATDWTIRELNYAQERKKRIVFINIDDIPLSNWFIFMFPQKQQVRAKNESEIEKLIRDLSHWLKIEERQTIKRVNEGKGLSPHSTPQNCKPTAHKAGPPNFKSHGGLGLRLALTKDDDGLNNYHCKLTLLHKDSVESALFSPNGKLIASASDDNTLCIWDAEKGNRLTRLKGHNDFVTCVAFNSDGSRIVSASDDETIRTWDVKSGSCLQILNGHEDSIWSASFSPDGKIIVSASVDNTIRIWNLATGNCIKTLYGHVRDVNHACFSPDGQRIVSASEDGTIRIWDSNLGSCMQVLRGHNDGVWHAKYSLDGKYIVSASADCTIRIWDAKNGNCIKVLEGHDDDVNSASFSSDGKYIVSASDDNSIRVWDALTGNCIQMLKGHDNFVNSAFFSPNDKQIVSASDDHTIIIWEKNY